MTPRIRVESGRVFLFNRQQFKCTAVYLNIMIFRDFYFRRFSNFQQYYNRLTSVRTCFADKKQK